MENEKRIAILIDSDNISPKYFSKILDEVASYGRITYRRIYGDWSAQNLSSWRKKLVNTGFLPIQQSRYIGGKNATDAAIIIDAMDILYGQTVDMFCLVTSDSDFSRLAIRLREAGTEVLGMGERKTPSAFIASCTMFRYLDVLTSDEDESEIPETPHLQDSAQVGAALSSAQSGAPTFRQDLADAEPYTITDEKSIIKAIRDFVQTSVADSTADERGVNIAILGFHLQKRFPEFDVRNYGFSKLSTFLESLEGFTLVYAGLKVFITIDDTKNNIDKKEVISFIKKAIKENNGGLKIAELNKKLLKEFPNFDVDSLGYSKLSAFLSDEKSFDLKWNVVKLK